MLSNFIDNAGDILLVKENMALYYVPYKANFPDKINQYKT
jgi:hypothetical protein